MKLPLEISYHHLEPSEFIEKNIREHAGKLDRFSSQIMSCRVTVESAHAHQQKGNPYQIRIDITVPGKEIIVSRNPGDQQAHDDVYVAIRDAFDAAKRQLEDYSQKIRGETKRHD